MDLVLALVEACLDVDTFFEIPLLHLLLVQQLPYYNKPCTSMWMGSFLLGFRFLDGDTAFLYGTLGAFCGLVGARAYEGVALARVSLSVELGIVRFFMLI
jgi:hypothetical protein